MAEFFIQKNSNTDPRGYQAGDIVDVREDGFNWTKSELPSVVKLPAISLRLAKQYGEEDMEVSIKVKETETRDTTGQLSYQRDGAEVRKVTSRDDVLIKSRTTSIEDIGDVKILNRDSEELLWEDESTSFNRRRWKMVGETIVDKLA